MSYDENAHNKLTISYELLALLRWLMDNNPDAMQTIVASALKTGLQKEIKRVHHEQYDNQDLGEMRYAIVDYFAFLESILRKEINAHNAKNAEQQDLNETLQKIDSNLCDDQTMQSSLEKAVIAMQDSTEQDNAQEEAKKLLLQELLREWNPPGHKNAIH